jgi:hypothetical protein
MEICRYNVRMTLKQNGNRIFYSVAVLAVLDFAWRLDCMTTNVCVGSKDTSMRPQDNAHGNITFFGPTIPIHKRATSDGSLRSSIHYYKVEWYHISYTILQFCPMPPATSNRVLTKLYPHRRPRQPHPAQPAREMANA